MSTSVVEETCSSATSVSDKHLPSTISENRQKNGTDEASQVDNFEKTFDRGSNQTSETNVSTDVNACDDTQSLEKGNFFNRF